MKIGKITQLCLGSLLLSLCVFSLAACSDEPTDEATLLPSVDNRTLSGEGESVLITFPNPDWQIAAISSLDRAFQIFGEIYGSDGKLIQNNVRLSLEGLGKIESIWSDVGFVITRDHLQALKVEALENNREADFGFIIHLKSETETKEIIIRQGQSAGYTFEKIEYTLVPNSHQTVLYKNGAFTFSNESSQEQEWVKYNPFQNQYDQLTFESQDPWAFLWMKDQALDVEVPGGVIHGELFYNREKIPYQTQATQLPLKFSVGDIPIKVPVGNSQCYFELEYEEYKATYRLHLRNNKTGVEKVFEGTFKSSCPNARYKLVWDSENQPKP